VSKAHTDAVLALLQADTSRRTYDAKVPADATMPYRTLFTDDGLDEATNLEAVPDVLTVLVQVTASGLNRTSTQIAMDKAHAALVGVTPTVAGRKCSPLRQINSRRITEDRDVTPHVLYAVSEYEFYSVPA
jgi:hypothetical protein